MSRAKAAPAVRFEATLYTIDGPAILRLPGKASNQLPSRGQAAVQATVNGHACQTAAEPDGEFGHWVRIDAKQQRAAALRAGTPRRSNPDTRQRRGEVSISKMQSRKRRPCCFNLAACTDPDLSKREADQSAMIHLARAVSEPCGPRG